MNTDIYIEIDHELEKNVLLNRPGLTNAARDIIKGDPFQKWQKKTEKWRKKCRERMFSKPWSAIKTVYVASINKK